MVQPFKVQIAGIIRDSIHNLPICEANELDNEEYFTKTKYFIGSLEGSRNEAYLDGIPNPDNSTEFISAAKFYSLDQATQDKLWDDCVTQHGRKPITTVGIGANLESENVRNKFDNLLEKPGLMDQVYYGKTNLTDEQVDVIFKDSVNERIGELRNTYGDAWDKFRLNERIGILSLHFNSPKLVNQGTNFNEHMQNYAKTSNELCLRRAVDEVVQNSNRGKNPGIQNRRDAEGTLLASYDCPTYTKPNQSPDVVKVKIATIGKTIIPLNNGDKPVNGNNSEYFIWRTQMDQNVRKKHILLDAKVFRKDNPPEYMPGSMHNCRCYSEEVPDYVLVNDEIAKNRAFELYLRKGIKHPILLID